MKARFQEDAGSLVHELRLGNPAAQQAFWHAYLPQLTGICLRITGDHFVADEIAVEVLGDFMLRYVHSIEHPQATVSYLRLMAIRRARKFKERRAKNVEIPADLGKDSELPMQTEDAALRSVVAPRLEKCLKKLKPKARRMVQLSFYKEMNHKQIGEMLGSSGQYVGRMIVKSLAFLKRCIQFDKLADQVPARR